MKPGEIKPAEGWIEINVGRDTKTVKVANTGDRPIQVGSHFHFMEVNKFLEFDREQAVGMHLNIPSGAASIQLWHRSDANCERHSERLRGSGLFAASEARLSQ